MSAGRDIVYVIDDDASIRIGLGRLLRSAGYRVSTFSDPKQFLEADRIDASACVVLDMMMPGISGLEVQKRLKVESPNLPVIFISGHLLPPMRELAREQGAAEIFEKPFEGDAILEAIQKAIG
ncbi:MAG: response regulator [Deltaproteobacteria bacterium]|nr:response regulator [Deltaproteobacteria bacterium]